MLRQTAAILLVVSILCVTVSPVTAATPATPDPAADPFALEGAKSILEEGHFGIVNGKLTTGIPYRNVSAIQGLWAPPYVSTDFALGVTVFDQAILPTHGIRFMSSGRARLRASASRV